MGINELKYSILTKFLPFDELLGLVDLVDLGSHEGAVEEVGDDGSDGHKPAITLQETPDCNGKGFRN